MRTSLGIPRNTAGGHAHDRRLVKAKLIKRILDANDRVVRVSLTRTEENAWRGMTKK